MQPEFQSRSRQAESVCRDMPGNLPGIEDGVAREVLDLQRGRTFIGGLDLRECDQILDAHRQRIVDALLRLVVEFRVARMEQLGKGAAKNVLGVAHLGGQALVTAAFLVELTQIVSVGFSDLAGRREAECEDDQDQRAAQRHGGMLQHAQQHDP